MQTRAVILASRRATTPSCARVRRNGAPARMSLVIRAGASSPAAGVGMRPRARCVVRVATDLVWQAAECVVRGLLLPADREQAGLPAAEALLVAKQEPEHHRDPWALAGELVRLGQVLRLPGPRHAEQVVGRTGLVAVLRDPELLVAVVLAEQLREHAQVRERHSLLALRLRERRLARAAVVRMVGVDVEAVLLQSVLVQRIQERDRRDRRPLAARRVVAPRVGGATGDYLLAQVGRVDAE